VGGATFEAAVQQIVRDGVPGVIGLQRRGDRVAVVPAGRADIATGQPVTGDDRFRVGSITKTFVATLVLKLVAEGRLRLTDSVARWLPGLVPGGTAITLRELLQPSRLASAPRDEARSARP
jgi:D-alanyl-D-alanine carboxypeptidase